jgi:O-antigen/teichoic acid export membrane protein
MMPGKSSSKGRKLLSGSALRLANLVVAAICSLFLMPFIVHHLGDRVYGFWSLAAGFIGYYGLLDLGLSGAVSQHICVAIGRGDPAECRTVFNTALRIQSLLGCVALLVTVLIAAAAITC